MQVSLTASPVFTTSPDDQIANGCRFSLDPIACDHLQYIAQVAFKPGEIREGEAYCIVLVDSEQHLVAESEPFILHYTDGVINVEVGFKGPYLRKGSVRCVRVVDLIEKPGEAWRRFREAMQEHEHKNG